jgi:hypothetical protein
MCPLRYILLFLSVLVALIGLSQAAIEADDQVSETSANNADDKKKTKFQTFLDMLSGRYLLNAYYGSTTMKSD